MRNHLPNSIIPHWRVVLRPWLNEGVMVAIWMVMLFNSAAAQIAGQQGMSMGIPQSKLEGRSNAGLSSSPLPRPTISPYLQLGRTDQGPLPNYHAFVQPQFELLRQQQTQWNAIQKMNSTMNSTNSTRPTTSLPHRSTGRGGRYMDTLHFFNPR